ncbi:hypothetical protein DAPPUDRAFT_267379 [Daphnia pulex]|uniref:Uncharacterized protein n=1 Tax=Daphnia pulex TaxID=6669 RepID=E9HWE1_DAPPU|nr:hypothetical protein DAPPUDRAFT_267379 [Daphnia pulex]|eukprot:EFX63935.1 hypothetical protein DAPPUDRAFT_267379 [Daphnia pulex]
MPPRRELTREEKDDKNRKAREKRSLEDQEAKEVDWLLRGKRQLGLSGLDQPFGSEN